MVHIFFHLCQYEDTRGHNQHQLIERKTKFGDILNVCYVLIKISYFGVNRVTDLKQVFWYYLVLKNCQIMPKKHKPFFNRPV